MKIEDINYTFPTAEIAEEEFNREKWVTEHPVDYFKFIYLLFSQTNKAPANIPRNLAMDTVFQLIYSVTRQYIPKVLFKFCSLTADEDLNNKKFSTLRDKKIFMSEIKNFNDPFDGKAFFYDPKVLSEIPRLKNHGGRLIDDFTVYHRGTALTENDTNCMPMWAHYANNHQGFCVSYDMEDAKNAALSGCSFPIQYTDARIDITSFMKDYVNMVAAEIDSQTAAGNKAVLINDLSLIYVAQYLCNIKHTTWSYEKEFRCTTGANSKGMPYIDASPNAIYVGMNCSKAHRQKLIEIADYSSLPIYQMKFDNLTDTYSLTAEPII